MSLTPSNAIAMGTKATTFDLQDTISDSNRNLDELKGDVATVIMFICNHCPFVQHIQSQLIKLANDYQDKGIAFIAISSNDVQTHPQDSPEKMKELALSMDYPFPYLYDESQEVAKQYDAACTPDFYVFNNALSLVYHGQLDDSRPGNNIPVSGKDMRAALDALLSDSPVDTRQKPSMGCNIKWR